MTKPLPTPPDSPAKPPLSSPAARIHRLQRIFARLEEGASYAAIAAEEEISAERVRQIVNSAAIKGDGPFKPKHWQMQLARLMPALRAARKNLLQGDAKAIQTFLAVLDRLDRYRKAQSNLSDSLIDPEAATEAAAARLDGLDGLGVYEEYETFMALKGSREKPEAAAAMDALDRTLADLAD